MFVAIREKVSKVGKIEFGVKLGEGGSCRCDVDVLGLAYKLVTYGEAMATAFIACVERRLLSESESNQITYSYTHHMPGRERTTFVNPGWRWVCINHLGIPTPVAAQHGQKKGRRR